MTIIDENTTREELEMAILQHDELYASFDEVKLLDGGYTTEELLDATIAWIESGDECA
jgi:hypothetical protein